MFDSTWNIGSFLLKFQWRRGERLCQLREESRQFVRKHACTHGAASPSMWALATTLMVWLTRSKIRIVSVIMKHSVGVPQIVALGTRHTRLNLVDVLVPDESDRSAGKPRQPGHGDGLVLRHLLFDRAATDRLRYAGRPGSLCGIGPDERIAPDVFSALDRFQQERRARS